MQWTWGHKGLSGTCLAYLVQEKLWKFKDWINRAESYRLGTYIFGQATYNRIMQYVREHAGNQEVYNMLVKLLEEGEFQCEHRMVVKLHDFIAQGVLVATEEDNGDYVVCLSSPLLRTAILRGCAIIGEEVDPPPNASRLDRKWVLLQAIRSLDADTICRPECLNARGGPSEYVHQFRFMCQIKSIIRQAYPFITARVLPEAKDIAMPGRRRSQLHLDTLVRDGDNLSKFGLELVASGSMSAIIEHIERAVRYHELHTAQVFVINFCLDRAQEQLVNPCHDSVIFVSVYFNVMVKSVVVTFVDMNGTTNPVDLPLKMWNGNISFKDL
ncbi:hypothetical protein GOP47_0021215 [Adiantum capillus-veneris]|uniref:Uncharacterized protein n=1 Tax=Adiantum capillus-veneris TaxID=13818 RepID=A0A9D4UB73_ADICA|nr:hypothetical protein GOP47_0021215 [Adiantum capillus-veneris]